VAPNLAASQHDLIRDMISAGALTQFQSYHLGCDKRIGFRRTGWLPHGVAPAQVAKFHRDQRYQILPAYTQDGILLSRVFQV
jgi:hypothetical protein